MNRRLSSIVAVNPNGIIGADNKLPWRVRSDMNFFRETTSGNVVVMGRKTFDSLNRKPLSNRLNVVLTHNLALIEPHPLLMAASSIEEALVVIDNAPSRFSEAYIIGGETMYRQFAGFVERYLVTLVRKEVINGDAWFDPDILGSLDDWQVSLLAEGAASLNDEASFEILEATALNAEIIRQRRKQAVDNYKARAKIRDKGNSRRNSPSQRSRARTELFAY